MNKHKLSKIVPRIPADKKKLFWSAMAENKAKCFSEETMLDEALKKIGLSLSDLKLQEKQFDVD